MVIYTLSNVFIIRIMFERSINNRESDQHIHVYSNYADLRITADNQC